MSRALDGSGELPASRAGDEGVESSDAEVVVSSSGGRRDRRPSSFRDGWIPWILLGLVLVGALLVGTGDDGGPPTNAERTYALARQVKCPQCAGQSVAESDVVISREIRRDIATRVESGQTDQQILDAYAARYGQEILLEPPTSGSSRVVWLLPVVALLAGLAVVVVVFRRWQATAGVTASEDDRALVADALAHDDRHRDASAATVPGPGDDPGDAAGEVSAPDPSDGEHEGGR